MKKYNYFINLNEINKCKRDEYHILTNIFKKETSLIHSQSLKEDIFNNFQYKYYQKTTRLETIQQIERVINDEHKKNLTYNHIIPIGDGDYYSLYLISKYVGMEWGLKLFPYSYWFEVNPIKNYLKSAICDVNDYIWGYIKDELFKILYLTIMDMVRKTLFINSKYIGGLIEQCKTKDKEEFFIKMKAEFEKMEYHNYVKYFWLKTAIDNIINFNKNIFIIYLLIERLVSHKWVILNKNITYYEIENTRNICNKNTFMLLLNLDKKFNKLLINALNK